jgi:hypothetical protein
MEGKNILLLNSNLILALLSKLPHTAALADNANTRRLPDLLVDYSRVS